MSKTVTLIGVTGLIGGHLYELLKQDTTIDHIRLLVRRPITKEDPRTEVKLVDFNDAESFRLAIEGSDIVFCAVGTTNKKVKGDKDAYRKVDYDIPVNAARFCQLAGCETFVLVSAVGAKSNSRSFYLKLKGEVEDAVKQMGIKSVHIMRPSLLLGERNESRTIEKMAERLMPVISRVIPSRYKAIQGRDVARAMISVTEENKPGFFIYEYRDMLGKLESNNTYESKWSKIAAGFDKHFGFLLTEFGMHRVAIPPSFYRMDKYVRILKNKFVQVELAGSKNYFDAEIRRLFDGQPRPYRDKDNNIGFEKLSVLLTNKTDAHLAYHSSAVGWDKALGYAAALLRQSRQVFTSEQWVDTKRLQQLEDEEFFKKWGFKPGENSNTPRFFDIVKTKATDILGKKGFRKTLDSDDIPPYDSESMVEKVVFERPGTKIKIAQLDWRDNYNTYYIELNGKQQLEADIAKQGDAVALFLDKLNEMAQ